MSDEDLKIDVSNHERVPTTAERMTHALLSVLFSFVLIQLIGFWLFPGPGLGGLYMISSTHQLVGFIGDITNILIIAVLAICGVMGWFRGKYFTDRLKRYLSWWKFW